MVTINRPPDQLVPDARVPGEYQSDNGIARQNANSLNKIASGTKQIAGAFLAKAKEIQDTQDGGELAAFQGFVAQQRIDQEAYMKSGASFETFEPEWDKRSKAIDDAKNKLNTRVRSIGGNFVNRNSPVWGASVTQKVQEGTMKQAKANALSAADLIAGSNLRDDAKVTNAAINKGNPEGPDHVNEMDIKMKQIEALIDNTNVGGELYDPLEKRQLMNSYEKKIIAYEKVRHLEEQTTPVYELINQNRYEDAYDLVKVVDITAKQKYDMNNIIEDEEKQYTVHQNEELTQNQEVDRGKVYDAIEAGQAELPDGSVTTNIRSFIESTSLGEDEQDEMLQKYRKETDRKLTGEAIVANSKVRSQLYKDTMGILTGSQTRDKILDRANKARYGDYSDPKNPIEPTMDETDYKALVTAVNAQYEQGYGQMMSKVNDFAEGILLNPDSLGYIKNAPIRHKIFGDFQQEWFNLIASKGDTLKITDIYPEGRKLAASFQVSESEAERREIEMNKELKAKESKKLTPKIARHYLDIAGDDIEEAKRLAAEEGYTE